MAVANLWLGYSGQLLAQEMMWHYKGYGYKFHYFTVLAFKLPLTFYFLAGALLVLPVIGTWRKFRETTFLYAAVAFLILDLLGVLALLWGYCLPLLRTTSIVS